MDRIIAACGNDCAACPRYTAPPYEKTEEELRRTAELWMKIGYRDRVVSTEEIACAGCKPENWCRYRVVKCCAEKGIRTCAECAEYPCENMRECFAVTQSFAPKCRQVCSDAEYARLERAFFEKERNLAALQTDIRPVTDADRGFWFSLDRHLDAAEFARKVRDGMGFVLTVGGKPTGILRWSLFWDSIPFCNLLYVKIDHQRKSFGRRLAAHWEKEMRTRGHDLVMTSTQSDEAAQRFWRRLGYRDCGGLTLPFPGHEQPTELILGKALGDLHDI